MLLLYFMICWLFTCSCSSKWFCTNQTDWNFTCVTYIAGVSNFSGQCIVRTPICSVIITIYVSTPQNLASSLLSSAGGAILGQPRGAQESPQVLWREEPWYKGGKLPCGCHKLPDCDPGFQVPQPPQVELHGPWWGSGHQEHQQVCSWFGML